MKYNTYTKLKTWRLVCFAAKGSGKWAIRWIGIEKQLVGISLYQAIKDYSKRHQSVGWNKPLISVIRSGTFWAVKYLINDWKPIWLMWKEI